MELKVELITTTAKMPTKAHDTDACFDLYVDEPDAFFENLGCEDGHAVVEKVEGVRIKPGETVKLHTGIATEIPQGYFCAVFPRSGLGVKQNLRLANCTGIIDADYRGEWIVALINDSNEPRVVKHGDRVAQFAVLPVPEVKLVEVETLSETERGAGGFGSSGAN